MNRVRKLVEAQPCKYTGKRVTVAILDSGIVAHPDFAGRISAFRNFTGKKQQPFDDSGHGTHVAGILAGDGSCCDRLYRGIAPDCHIVMGKVLKENGEGSIDDMINAINWVLSIKEQYHIKILNISAGVEKIREKKKEQDLIKCLEKAWDKGLFVIVAAGNQGPINGSLSSLGEGEKVISVGCHEGRDGIYFKSSCEDYSGRGKVGCIPRKPDIVAPGTEIMSTNAFFRRIKRGIKDGYIRKSGTSMAVPVVAGAAALFFEKYPLADNEMVKQAMLSSALDMRDAPNKQGWGMLQIQKMLKG